VRSGESLYYCEGRVRTGVMSELIGTSASERDSFLKAEKHHNSKKDGEKNLGKKNRTSMYTFIQKFSVFHTFCMQSFQ
jgi:hypothetical protein